MSSGEVDARALARAQNQESAGDVYGAHRVLEPAHALPQAAWRVDNDFSRRFDTEIEVAVERLNLDAASFRQLYEAAQGDLDALARAVLDTIAARGKQHNPVTGSGGMLLGSITRIGSAVRTDAKLGERIASLVSLSLTPLHLDEIREVHAASGQLAVRGRAVLFASAPFALLPRDLPERVALAALDVCGAPAQVARSAGPGDLVLVLGAGGKSGLLCCAEARRHVGSGGVVVGVEAGAAAAAELRALGFCNQVLELDAREPLALRAGVLAATGGREFDLVVSCVNVEGAELPAVLCARERGRVLFFAMTTQFGRAALGAEGVGKDVDLLIGNGYVAGHAELTLGLLRRYAPLRALFERRYAQ
jgi:L-erythro-3,5-diaminohexanoate dehydrogenase